jgi:TRAP-type C4-dicarboxylate transport system permease small subunit
MKLTAATRLLEAVSAILLLALIAVTATDVVGRYILNAPLSGAFEMTELLLGALVFAALPLVSRSGSHVEVDLLVAVLPDGVNRVLGFFAATVSALVLVFFGWRLALLGVQQFHDGARSVSLGFPYWPFAALGMASCLMAAVFGLLRAREE